MWEGAQRPARPHTRGVLGVGRGILTAPTYLVLPQRRPWLPVAVEPDALQVRVEIARHDIDTIGAPGDGGGRDRHLAAQGCPGLPADTAAVADIVPDMLQARVGAAGENVKPVGTPGGNGGR